MANKVVTEKLKEAANEVSTKETKFWLALVKIDRDPQSAWAADDPAITYDQFLVEQDICDPKAYRAFEAGLNLSDPLR